PRPQSPRRLPQATPRQVSRIISALEDGIAALALAAMVVLPIAEIIVRRLFGVGIPGSGPFVQHLTLWIGFLGAAIAAREGKLLSLATGTFIPEGRPRDIAFAFASAVAAGISTILAWGAVELVVSEREVGSIIAAGVPTWVGELALPIGFTLIALRLAWRAGTTEQAGEAAPTGLEELAGQAGKGGKAGSAGEAGRGGGGGRVVRVVP